MNRVFCYGSLVNSMSRLKTIGRITTGTYCRLLAGAGYARQWSIHSTRSSDGEKLTALALNRADDEWVYAVPVGGIIIEVTDKELGKLDEREKGYVRESVPITLFDVWREGEKEGEEGKEGGKGKEGKVFAYVADRIEIATYEFPIRRSYLNTCIDGFLEYGNKALEEFMCSIEQV